MTVLELIENLQKMDADAPVMFSSTDIRWEPIEILPIKVLSVEDGRVILSAD